MAEQYYPYDAGAGSAVFESDWTKIFLGLGVGVIPDQDNELQVTPGAPSRAVVVKSGKAVCFGHAYINTSDLTLSLAANNAGGTLRYDAIVIEWDWANNDANAVVVEGTAGANPSIPSLTQSLSTKWQHLIGVAAIPASDTSTDAGDTFEALDRWLSRPDGLDVPLGSIQAWALPESAGLPNGWLVCNGQSVDARKYTKLRSKMSTYASGLFGLDSGNELIYVPDLRGRVPAGLDNMGGIDAGRLATPAWPNTLGTAGGEELHALVSAELAAHTHSDGSFATDSQGAHSHDDGTSYQFIKGSTAASTIYTNSGANVDHGPAWNLTADDLTGVQGAHTHDVTGTSGSTGSSTGHNTMQPTQLVNYIIKMF